MLFMVRISINPQGCLVLTIPRMVFVDTAGVKDLDTTSSGMLRLAIGKEQDELPSKHLRCFGQG